MGIGVTRLSSVLANRTYFLHCALALELALRALDAA
jgi:hypothetical protein